MLHSICNRRRFSAESAAQWIVRLKDSLLQWNSPTSTCFRVDSMEIKRTGGHALLGPNGSGKSLLLNALGQPETFIANSSKSFLHVNEDSLRPLTARVSFESHYELLERGGSVQATLGKHLTGTTQYLVVRFGLFHLLTRQVTTLSTGEIRKVLLIAAISARPRILVLDNAFDGLDVESRGVLKDIVSKTIAGFRMDVLVQGVTTPPPTQVIVSTHRSEEISDEVSVVTTCLGGEYTTTERRGADTPIDVAPGHPDASNSNEPWDDPELPTRDEIRAIVSKGAGVQTMVTEPPVLIDVDQLELMKGDKQLLSGISLQIRQGERWLFAGGNGAGKSTLSRLLAETQGDPAMVRYNLAVDDIGWVSTEKHMSAVRSNLTTAKFLESSCIDARNKVMDWLQICSSHESRPFHHLSQGEQKLVLIAETLLMAPKILILDEITQGLDTKGRHRVLGLVERWCSSTDTSLIYVTHHKEEILPCITKVLTLDDGKGYCSDR